MPLKANKTTKHGLALFPWIIFGLGALFYAYNYLLRIEPSIMYTGLALTYKIKTAFVLGNLSAYYYYVYAPMQIPVGILMDRFGPRRLLTLAGICCALGAYFFASSATLVFAEFGRFLIGFGSAFAFIGVLKLGTIWLFDSRFGLIIGILLSVGMIGGVLGEVVLTQLITVEGWRLTSYFIASLGMVLTLLMFLIFRDGARQSCGKCRKDYASYRKLFVALLISVRKPQIWVNGLIGCLLWLPISAFAGLWGEPYLKATYGFSNLNAASFVALIFMGWILGAPLFGVLSDFVKQRRVFLTMGATFAAILLATIFYVPNIPRVVLGISFFLLGLSTSSQILVFAIAREITATKAIGTILALTNTFIVISGMVFQPLIGWFLDLFWTGEQSGGLHVYSVSAYQIAFIVLPVALVLAVFMTFFLQETSCEPL